MNKKIKVGVDIDGVIWDLVTPWITRFNHLTGDDLSLEDIKTYDLESHIKKGNPNLLYSILKLRVFWNNLEPYTDSVYWLKKFNEEFDLYIITSTSYKTPSDKFNRFFELFPFLNEKQLIVCHKKSLINVDYMIDDYEKNLQFGTFKKLLRHQPYNSNFPNKMYGIDRVHSLEEAYYKIIAN